MKRKLLIIDDESSHSRFIKWILEDESYKFFTANSFKDAVKLLEREKFHLILLDLIMPDEDGFEILDYLKRDEKLRDIPVLVVSAKNDRESIEASLRKGAVDYVVKPYSSEVLHNKIALILRMGLEIK